MLKKIPTALSLIALLAMMAIGITGCEEGAPVVDNSKTEETVEEIVAGPPPTVEPTVGSGTTGTPEAKPPPDLAPSVTGEVESSPDVAGDATEATAKVTPPSETEVVSGVVVKPFGWFFEKKLWAVLTKEFQSSRLLFTKDDFKQFFYPYIQVAGSSQKPTFSCNAGLETAMFQKIEDSKDPCFLEGQTCWTAVILFKNDFTGQTQCTLKVGEDFSQTITVQSGKTYIPPP